MGLAINVPKLGMTMESAIIVQWLISNGELVEKGDPIVELEIDKATITIESPGVGYISIVAKEDDELAVGKLLGWLNNSPDETTVEEGA